MNIQELSARLGNAINESLRSDAIADAVAEIQAAGYEVGALILEMSIGQTRLSYPVPIEPSVRWLEHLHRLEDRR